jgi:hypothetical protein
MRDLTPYELHEGEQKSENTTSLVLNFYNW